MICDIGKGWKIVIMNLWLSNASVSFQVPANAFHLRLINVFLYDMDLLWEESSVTHSKAYRSLCKQYLYMISIYQMYRQDYQIYNTKLLVGYYTCDDLYNFIQAK